jgi:hypothetical protein
LNEVRCAFIDSAFRRTSSSSPSLNDDDDDDDDEQQQQHQRSGGGSGSTAAAPEAAARGVVYMVYNLASAWEITNASTRHALALYDVGTNDFAAEDVIDSAEKSRAFDGKMFVTRGLSISRRRLKAFINKLREQRRKEISAILGRLDPATVKYVNDYTAEEEEGGGDRWRERKSASSSDSSVSISATQAFVLRVFRVAQREGSEESHAAHNLCVLSGTIVQSLRSLSSSAGASSS